MFSLGPMAIRPKRPLSALSNRSASNSHKKRRIAPGEQSIQLSALPSMQAHPRSHGGLPECPGAPKLDEARDLSPMSAAPIGMFGDIPTASLDYPLPNTEETASRVADSQQPTHQEDHLLSNMSGLHLDERQELSYSRGDHPHHQPAFVGPGLNTVLVSRHQYHSYFDGQASTLLPPARENICEKLIQRLPTSSSIPFQPAPLRPWARRALHIRSGLEYELTEADTTSAQHQDAHQADDRTEIEGDALPPRSRAPGAGYHYTHGFDAHRSSALRTPSYSHALRRQAQAGHLREAYELQARRRMSYVEHWVQQVASSIPDRRCDSQTGMVGATVVPEDSFGNSARAENMGMAMWLRGQV